MFSILRTARAFTAAFVCLFILNSAVPSAHAQLTWDASGTANSTGPIPPTDGGGLWDTGAAFWFNGTNDVGWSDGNAVVFGVNNGAAGTVTIDAGNVVAAGLTFNVPGSGNYTIASTNGTLGLGNATITVASGLSPTINAVITGSAGLTLSGGTTAASSTLTLGAVNNYTSNTTLDGGTLVLASGANGTSLSGQLIFGATVGSVNTSGLDLTNASLTVTGLTVRTGPTPTAANTVTIGAGKSLTVNNNTDIVIGVANQANTTAINFTGGGTFAGTGAAGTNFIIAPESNTAGNSVTVDMSGLSNFTYTTTAAAAGTGQFRIAGGTGNGTGDRSNATVTFANTSNTITAAGFIVGGGSNSNNNNTNPPGAVLHLGAGTNVINATTFQVSNQKSTAVLDFAGATGSLKIRGTGGTDSDRADITIGSRSVSGSVAATGNMNLNGHSVDIMAGTILIGNNSNSNAGEAGTLSFDTGTINANSVQLGVRSNGGVTGTLNVSGTGLLNVVTSAGITLTNSSSNAGIGKLNITGGTVQTAGDIAEGTNKSGLSTLLLNGGTLDMQTHNIGLGSSAATGAIDTLTLQSGTLKNVGQINAGNPFSLTTTGTDNLILDGTNTFTGAMTINGGNVTVGSGGNSGTLGSGTTVTNNGTLTFNRSGILTVAQAIGGGGPLTQSGSGTITLSNTSGYSGATNINAGILSVTGTLSSTTSVGVNTSGTSAGTLSGTGTVSSLVTLAANNGANVARIAPGATAADGSTGTLNLANLNLNGGDLRFDVGSDLLNVTGTANFTNLVSISPTAAVGVGSYEVLAAGTLNIVTVPTVNQAGGRVSFALNLTHANQIWLDVTGTAGNLVWKGNINDGSGHFLWDIATTQNWTNAGNPDSFQTGDNVTFDSTGVNKVVTLNTQVSPGSVTVNTSGGNYTIDGTGGIIGNTGLTKISAGTLTLGGNNTYLGATAVQNGTLKLNSPTALSSATSVTLGDATHSGILDLNGNSISIGALNNGATGSSNIVENKGASGATLTVTGGGNFAGTIQDDAQTALTVSGGTLTLTGPNAYTGATSITGGGTLVFTTSGNLGNGTAINFDNGTLKYSATAGNVDISTRTLTSNAGGATIDTNGNTVTLANSIGNSGTGGFTKTGGGTLTLSSAVSYTGGTTIIGGTLALGGPEFLPDSAPLNVNGGTLNLQPGNTETVGNVTLDGAGTINSTGSALSGTSFAVKSGTVNAVLAGGANGLTKTTAGTVTLNAVNTYSGSTTLDGGTLVYGSGADGSNVHALTFGAASGNATASTLDASAANLNASNLTVQTDNTSTVPTANSISIGAGKTLAITGTVSVGTGLAGVPTNLTVTGTGALTVNATNFIVGLSNGTSGAPATVDLSLLSTFSFSGTNFSIGANGNSHATGTVTLANTSNTITAPTLQLGDGSSQNAGSGTLNLGAGTNIINATNIDIGRAKSSGTLQFASSTGSLVIRAANGTDRATIDTADAVGGGSTSATLTSNLAFNGHSVDIQASTLTLGRRTTAGTGGVNATLSFDTGTIDTTTLAMAFHNNGGAATANLNVGGTAVLNVGTGGFSLVSGSPATGTLTVSGTATVQSDSDIVEGGNTANETGTINLNGGVLDLASISSPGFYHSIGSSTTLVDALKFQTGQLKNFTNAFVGSLEGTGGSITGAPLTPASLTVGNATSNTTYSGTLNDGGGLNGTLQLAKQNNSSLTLTANNSYSGGTTISGGTLQLGSASDTVSHTSVLGSGPVSNSATLAFGSSHTVTLNNAVSGPGQVIVNSGTAKLGGNNSYSGGTTVNAGSLVVTSVTGLGDPINGPGLTINGTSTATLQAGLSAPVQLPALTIAGGASLPAELEGTGLTATNGWLDGDDLGSTGSVQQGSPLSGGGAAAPVSVQPVPEPAGFVLAAIGIAGLLLRRRFRN